jgi:transglutaminase-like putative cysteine protease
MVLLFLFFPRLDPLWSLPQPSTKAQTGLSDSMAPGDIAELSKSAALAFRASFEGPLPPRSQLYWRALTLDQFDGRRWSQSSRALVPDAPLWRPEGPSVRYSVVLEPTGKPWLMTLDVGQTDLAGVRQMSDFRWQRRRSVEQSILYAAESWPNVVRETVLSEGARLQALQLPARGNPQVREWAADLHRHHGEADAVVDALLAYFTAQPFRYTLKPPALGANSVDDFLFGSRAGFCEHYAGAMTFALRAAGVPARVVTGYQGGELNPDGNYLSVRQFDAHAWVEYWQAGVGWRSVDPTAAVAPMRVEQGLEQALAADEEFLGDSPMSALRYRNLAWLNSIRMSWDSLDYGWQRWVLGYQGQQQLQVLGRWFSGFQAQVFAGGAVIILGLLALWLLKPWQRQSDFQLRVFNRFERLLARQGLKRQPGEGAQAFAQRAGERLPAQAQAIEAFVREFQAQRYAGGGGSHATLRQHLKSLRRSLPWRLSALKDKQP